MAAKRRRRARRIRRGRPWRSLLLMLALLMAVGGGAWAVIVQGYGLQLAGSTVDALARETSPDHEQLTMGSRVYDEACAKCHGTDLSGEFGQYTKQMKGIREEIIKLAKDLGRDEEVELATAKEIAPAHDNSGESWRYSDEELFEIVKFGGERLDDDGTDSRMPAFEHRLSDAEIWASIAYIKNFWPPEIRANRQ